MKRIIVRDFTPIPPFGEPARELRILNKPLWLIQRDVLARYCKGMLECNALDEVPAESDDEMLVCRDNIFFNSELIDAFISEARDRGYACQIAFSRDDRAITTHALPLQSGIRLHDKEDVYVADLYYYPPGKRQEPKPCPIKTQAYEMGYYHIPSYMAPNQGELVFQVPNRVFLSVENWVHIYLANTPLGVFNWARHNDEKMQRASLRTIHRWTREDRQALLPKLKLVMTAFLERINPLEEAWRNHFLACKELVKIGKNCSIDPTAIIHGPTIIGDNVYIGPGTVITNSLIGNNVNIMQGSQVMLSVVSDRCFLPFNSGLFMSSLMENSMVAQNTTVQLCVIGRNTFIGANNVFTDFNLLGEPIRTYHQGRLEEVCMPVLGSAVGHNCRIGSGFVVYPGRMIGSDSVLILDSPQTNLIKKNVNIYAEPDPVDPEEEPEPRLTVYHWPHAVRGPGVEPSTAEGGTTDTEHQAPANGTHGHLPERRDNYPTTAAAATNEPPQMHTRSNTARGAAHPAQGHSVHVGG
jgi:acetyltransferase-like isoleucine patch superfamily enzyme